MEKNPAFTICQFPNKKKKSRALCIFLAQHFRSVPC